MAAGTRSGQSRRRGGQLWEGGGRTWSSWELLERNRRGSNADEHAMEIDSTPELPEKNQSLRSIAERVGNQVETFAEELDRFKHKITLNTNRKHQAAVELVESWQTTARSNHVNLKKAHGPQLRQKFQQSCRPDNYSTVEALDDGDALTTIADLEHSRAELNTWQLFHNFLELDYPNTALTEIKHGARVDRFKLDGALWQDFVESSDIAKERLKILQWLESTAEVTGNDVELIEEEAAGESGGDGSLLYHGWMDTRERIKAEKRIRFQNTGLGNIKRSDGGELLVTQLDPDAVTREGGVLEKSDEKFERTFWNLCWAMLRRGYSMDKIQEWCTEKNQLAMAFSLGAGADYNPQAETYHRRWLWRKACTAAAEKGLDLHERGVYSLLSGISQPASSVCKTWYDFLFVDYNSRLLQQYESYLATNIKSQSSETDMRSFPAPKVHTIEGSRVSAAQAAAKQVFRDATASEEATSPFELVQKALINHSGPDLIFYHGVVLAREADNTFLAEFRSSEPATLLSANDKLPDLTDDPDVLRVMAHMYLVYKELGVDFGTGLRLKAAENVICHYIQFLRLIGKVHLIPLYASQLSSDSTTQVLGRCLASIMMSSQDQEMLVALMVQYGIDVPHVLTYQARMAINYSERGNKMDAPIIKPQLLESVSDRRWPGLRLKPFKQESILDSDELLIRAMEWYLLVEGGWGRMFQSLTEISIAFLKSSRIHAALELFQRLPFADISVSKKPSDFKQPVDILDDSDSEDDASDAGGTEDGSPPALRHSASLSFRSQHHNYRNFGVPVRQIAPGKVKVRRALYKAHARTYFELGQLVEALRRLYSWKEAEQVQAERERASHGAKLADVGINDVRQECRKRLDALHRAMEPLLHEFLTRPAPGVTPRLLRDLRRAYLPQMILAYAGALHSGAFLLGRERMLQCMDLATDIAANEQLVGDIKAAGEMPRLVDVFARASKGMLYLNEHASKTSSKKRAKNGKSYAIWELT